MEESLARYNALELAYLGDAVYELGIRRRLLKDAVGVAAMNKRAFQIVNAHTQAVVVKALEAELSAAEWEMVKYGRNAKGGSSRAATMGEYRYATGFETLLGGLYLQDALGRIDEIIDRAIVLSQVAIDG